MSTDTDGYSFLRRAGTLAPLNSSGAGVAGSRPKPRRHRQAHPSAHGSQGYRVGLIRDMIANRSFETHLQPIVDLRSGDIVGVEALSRFAQLPVRPPDAWFAEAAALGLGVKMELAALTMALERLDSLPAGMYLSLNASAEAILSGEFRSTMAGVPAERIVLELTEHTRVADYPEFARAIRSLRSNGLRLAVDDAGSGFASFTHILNLRPEVIKLDIALIRGIDVDPAKEALARALLNFGTEAFGTTFVAEGIETRGELRALRSLGFHSGQGFILGRPSRNVEAVELIQRPSATFLHEGSAARPDSTGSGTAAARIDPPRT